MTVDGQGGCGCGAPGRWRCGRWVANTLSVNIMTVFILIVHHNGHCILGKSGTPLYETGLFGCVKDCVGLHILVLRVGGGQSRGQTGVSY